MKKVLIGTVAMLFLVSPAAAANCSDDDLRGRWDICGFTDHLAFLEAEAPVFFDSTSFATTLDCVFRIGRSGRIARTTCIERFPSLGVERITTRGELNIRGNCVVKGEVNGCELQGTMTVSKDAIMGVAHCEVPQPNFDFPGDFLTMFTMVRR
jgi:hypothetical protein